MKLDEIGWWSEQKLEIVAKYAKAYSTVLAGQPHTRFRKVYIDAFAGPGYALSKTTGDRVLGSPLRALSVEPPFDEFHFIDLDQGKLDHLRQLVQDKPNVFLYNANCNDILCNDVFPSVRYDEYRRALCLLDPYGLHLRWNVFATAARMKTIEILVNFSVMDLNMNCGLRDPSKITPDQAARLTAFWGDESWREAVYTTTPAQPNLFGEPKKAPNEAVAAAFCTRLKETAGFAYVAPPAPMRNSRGAIVYYLVFASQNETGAKIASEIFAAYRTT